MIAVSYVRGDKYLSLFLSLMQRAASLLAVRVTSHATLLSRATCFYLARKSLSKTSPPDVTLDDVIIRLGQMLLNAPPLSRVASSRVTWRRDVSRHASSDMWRLNAASSTSLAQLCSCSNLHHSQGMCNHLLHAFKPTFRNNVSPY